MTADEFASLRPGDRVQWGGVERRVLEHLGRVVALSDGEGVMSVPIERADRLSLLGRAEGAPAGQRDADWEAVAQHLRLVNLVRARIGQREIGRNSGYTPEDVKADAEFYAATQSWARARARELGI